MTERERVLFLCTNNAARSPDGRGTASAKESCPILPGHGTQMNWSFDDPSSANGVTKSNAECSDGSVTRSGLA